MATWRDCALAVVGIGSCHGQADPLVLSADIPRVEPCDQPGPHFSRTIIALDSLVPIPMQDQQMQSLVAAFSQLRIAWPLHSCFWDLDVLEWLPDLPKTCKHVMQSIAQWSNEPVEQVHIFVDGSSFSTNRQSTDIPAAWAFIVILKCQCKSSEFSFRYYCATSHVLSGSAVTNPDFDIGELLHDALTAEATGMTWVLAWIAQSPFECEHVVHYDNNTVGGFAAGFSQWHPTWEYMKLRKGINALIHFLRSCRLHFSFHHLKSHNGDPWSEGVDSLAKATAKGIVLGPNLPSTVSAALKHPYVEHAWTGFCDAHSIPAPHTFRALFQAEGPFTKQQVDTTWWRHAPALDLAGATVSLTLVTANVLTLSPGSKTKQQQGLLEQGRIANLQGQFAHAKVLIAGLQECRTQQALTRHSSTHWVYQSGAAEDGSRGCELWLAKQVAYATTDKQQHFFHDQHVHISSFSDRHLLAQIKAPHLRLQVMVLHAPHAQATDTNLTEWWDKIGRILTRSQSNVPTIILGDINARFGTVISDSISGHAAEEENESGHHAHAFLLEHSLWAPATFTACHQGPSATWVASQGNMHRLDYIFLPQQWQSFNVKSYVRHDLDLATVKADHFAAALEVQFSTKQPTHRQPPRCRIDVRKCQDPELKKLFVQYMNDAPPIPWVAGVGLHAEILTEWASQGVQKFFKPDRKIPKQRYLSDRTWTLILLRKQLLKIFHESQCHHRKLSQKLMLQKWFALYQQRQAKEIIPDDQTQHISTMICQMRLAKMWTLHFRRKLHTITRCASKNDRIHTASQLVDQFYQAAHTRDPKVLYRSLKPLLGQQHRTAQLAFRPIPAVRLKDGTLASTHEEAATRWREHFAQPEQGTAATVAMIQHTAQHEFQTYDRSQLPFHVPCIPSLLDIEEYILKAKRGKSPGIDGLPAEVYKIAPQIWSRLLWPLLTKTAIRCSEPLRWKGGEVVALPKMAHAGHHADRYRSILLADFSSKISHGLIRQKLLPFFQQYRQNMQAGGVPHLSTDFFIFFTQGFSQYAKTNGLSSASLFVDIQQAFYRACRPLLVQYPVHEADIIHVFQENGWPEELYREFQSHLQDQTAFSQAMVPPLLQAQVSNILHATWFQLRSQSQTLTHTRTGTKPGDSIADLLFAFLMARFLASLRVQFIQTGLHTELPIAWIPPGPVNAGEIPAQNLVEAAWVDDLVLLIQAQTPAILVEKIRVAAAIVYEQAAAFSLKLNLKRDKTSVIVSFRGPTAKQQWAQLLQDDPCKPMIAFECPSLAAPLFLEVLPDYVYLGVLQDQKGHPAVEVRRRLLSVQAITNILREGIFKSPRLPVTTKRQLFRSLVLSKLTFSAGAWQFMHSHTTLMWISQLTQLYARFAGAIKRGPGVHTLDIIASSHLPHPLLLLVHMRLALYDRVMQTEMTQLMALLQNQDPQVGWLAMICDDLIRLQPLCPHTQLNQLALQSNHAELATFSFTHPKVLSKYAKQAAKMHGKYLDIWAAVRSFQQAFEHDADRYGLEWTHNVVPDFAPGMFECEHCPASFSTFQALCTHEFKRRSLVNVVHSYAISNTCRACLKRYHSRTELIHHLKYYRTGCLLKLVASVHPLPPDELEALQQSEQQSRKATKNVPRQKQHKQPMVRLPGSHRPWPWQRHWTSHCMDSRSNVPDPEQEWEAWAQHVLLSLEACDVAHTYQVLSQTPYHGQLAERLFMLHRQQSDDIDAYQAMHQIDTHATLQEAVCLWRHAHMPDPAQEYAGIEPHTIRITLRQIRVPKPPEPQAAQTAHELRAHNLDTQWHRAHIPSQLHAQIRREQTKVYTWPTCKTNVLVRKPVFVYVFSGRRRVGDYQAALEKHLSTYEVEGQVLLLDLAISPLHDVTQDHLLQLLLGWCAAGFIASGLIAPPCETWSEARHNSSEHGDAPRPLRTAMYPFGVDGLRPAELAQVLTSSQLLFVALRFFLATVMFQIPMIMEHPKEPRSSDRASVWRLPWVRALETHPAVQRFLIWQAEYGAASPKPTHLMVGHVVEFRRIFSRHKIHVKWDQLETLQGKDSSGQWRTAKGKEYPAGLNDAIAECHVVSHLCRLVDAAIIDTPSHFEDQLRELHSQDLECEDQTMRPDYAGPSFAHFDALD